MLKITNLDLVCLFNGLKQIKTSSMTKRSEKPIYTARLFEPLVYMRAPEQEISKQ